MVLDRSGSSGKRPLATPNSIVSSSAPPLILPPYLSATAPSPTNRFLVRQPYPGINQIQYCTQTLPSSHITGHLSSNQVHHERYTLPQPSANPTRPLANMQSSLYAARFQAPYIPTRVVENMLPPALSSRTQSVRYPTPASASLPSPLYNPTGFLNYRPCPSEAREHPKPNNHVGINQPVYTGTEQLSRPTVALQNNPSVMSTRSFPVDLGPSMRPMPQSLGFMPGFGSGNYHGATNGTSYMQNPLSTGNPSMSVKRSPPIIINLEDDDEEDQPVITSTAEESPHGKVPMLAEEPITLRKTSETEKSPEDAPVETLLPNEKKPSAISLPVAKQGEDLSKPNVSAGLGSSNETVDVVAAVGPDVSDVEAEDGEPLVKKKKLSSPLADEEIKADFLAITGSLPPPEPRKRETDVETQLGGIFPGSSLGGILTDETSDSEDP